MTISGSYYIQVSASELEYRCSQIKLSTKVEYTLKKYMNQLTPYVIKCSVYFMMTVK